MGDTVERVTPHTSPHSVPRQQAVFEGGGETGIFISLRVYMERECSEFFQVPSSIKRELAYLEGESSISFSFP